VVEKVDVNKIDLTPIRVTPIRDAEFDGKGDRLEIRIEPH
jgi:hypothetical protein